jgi:hypothetical protein
MPRTPRVIVELHATRTMLSNPIRLTRRAGNCACTWLFLTTASHAASQQALVEGAKREREPLHPNAARLYVDFVLSKEGQAIMRGFHRLSARTDLMQDKPGS